MPPDENQFWQIAALHELRAEDRIAAIQEIRDQAFLVFLFQLEIDESVRGGIARCLWDQREIVNLLLFTWYDPLYLSAFLSRLNTRHLEVVASQARAYGIRKQAQRVLVEDASMRRRVQRGR